MKWVRFAIEEQTRWGLLTGDEIETVSLEWPEILSGHAPENTSRVKLEDVRLRSPIEVPSKILAIGQNYLDHCREQNKQPPSKPLIFTVLPSAVIGPNDQICWSRALTREVDLEAELAVVIGKRAHQVDPDTALDHVFGYTVANDVTARDLQASDGQWTRAKGMDTFCPLGPALVSADSIASPQNLAIRSEVNGKVMQSSSTSEMIFSVAELISYISQGITLNPGDVLLTGTPDGVGKFRNPPIFLNDGDKVAVEIESIGRMENTCRVFD